ncbi:MAG: hypothetical protein FWB83_03140 [Treponema sp.]|nr:hypothetical protein [Treponema sp.]
MKKEMKIFKKCPVGHVYSMKSKECPYCKGRKLDDELEKLPENEVKELPPVALCYAPKPFDDDEY